MLPFDRTAHGRNLLFLTGAKRIGSTVWSTDCKAFGVDRVAAAIVDASCWACSCGVHL